MEKKKTRKLEDLRNKYPIEDILLAANTASMNIISKQFKISKTVIIKIIKRYGSDLLKEKVSNRHPHKKKELEKNSPAPSLENNLENLKATLTLLQTPLLNLSNLQSKILFYTSKIEYVINDGDNLIKTLVRDLSDKNFDIERIKEVELLLKGFMEFKLDAIKLLLSSCRVQIEAQTKYVQLEVVNRDLEDIRILINIFFEAFNVLDEKSYKKVKAFILASAPPMESYFYEFERTYRDYKAKLYKEAFAGSEQDLKV